MEENKHSIQKTAQTGLAILPDNRIVKAVYQFNQLRAYSLTEIEIMEWARSIERLVPDLDVDALNFAIDCMKTGEIDFDMKSGIQNIFEALKKVEKTSTGYKILKAIW